LQEAEESGMEFASIDTTVERDERLVFSLNVCGQRVTRSSPLRLFKEREVN
jgi:hypothetical protein